MNKPTGRKHDYDSLTWRGSLLIVGMASLEFLLPTAWARWTLAVAFGVACFAILVIDKARESPGVGAALGLCAVGAVLFGLGALLLPPEAFFSGKLWRVEAQPSTWLTCGAGFVIAGVAFGTWRLIVAFVQFIRRWR